MRKYIQMTPMSLIINILMVYVCYMICRFVFVAENWPIFRGSLDLHLALRMLVGALRFDTTAIMYTNLLYFLLVLLPLHYKETPVMRKVIKWSYIIPNALGIIVNLMDTVYFPYTLRRTTVSIFREFGGNTNLGSVFGVEFVSHWYLAVLAAAMITMLWCFYVNTISLYKGESRKHYYIRQSMMLVIIAPFIALGIRGNSFFHINRPIYPTLANEYINAPAQAGIVLNTPFTLIRSSSRPVIDVPQFYTSLSEAENIYSPVHHPSDSTVANHKNIVVILVESLGEEFVSKMHRQESGSKKMVLTPFVDSLYSVSLTWDQCFANGRKSIDAVPIVLASLPKMYNSYAESAYAMNDTPGMAKELANLGYHSAFFHGAEDSSLGIKGMALSTGVEEYFGLSEYVDDPKYGGRQDYDGTWGIWDDKFLQFCSTKLSDLPQPFVSVILTLSNHHPFALPDGFEVYVSDTDPKQPLQRTVQYTDFALRKFFESARQQDWYENTIFVITADHAPREISCDAYRTDNGSFRIPILVFDPSGELPRGVVPGVAQQIDIMPTLLGIIGYDRPYVAYGKDLLSTPSDQTWAFMYHDTPQLFKGDYLVQMAGYKLSGVYKYKSDFDLKNNLLLSGDFDQAQISEMVDQLQAILQSVDTRMRTNALRQLIIDN